MVDRKGENNPNAKLTEDKVRQIRDMHEKLKMGRVKLGKLFQISPSTVDRILKREIWKDI